MSGKELDTVSGSAFYCHFLPFFVFWNCNRNGSGTFEFRLPVSIQGFLKCSRLRRFQMKGAGSYGYRRRAGQAV